MTLFNPVFNCLTPIVIKRSKTQADEGLTTADEAGYVVLRQPPASKLANLFRIDVRVQRGQPPATRKGETFACRADQEGGCPAGRSLAD